MGHLTTTSLISSLYAFFFAILILSRNNKNFHNILLFFCILLVALSEFCIYKSTCAEVLDPSLFWPRLTIVFLSLQPGSWYLFCITFSRKKASLEVQRNLILVATFFLCGFFFIFNAFSSDFIFIPLVDQSAYMFKKVVLLGRTGGMFCTFILASMVIILFVLENTYFYAKREKNWKYIKPVIVGVSLETSSVVFFTSYLLLYNTVFLDILYINSIVIILSMSLILFTLVRHNTYDVDIFISRYVFYKSAVVVIIGIYLFILGILGQLERVIGEEFKFFLNLIFSTALTSFLAFIYLSKNFRERCKNFIIAHFYKNKYDYHFEWVKFTKSISSVAKWQELLPKLAYEILMTLDTENVSIWLKKENECEFQLKTLLGSKSSCRDIAFKEDMLPDIKNAIVDLEDNKYLHIKQAFPELLNDLKARLIVPMLVKDALIGFIIVGNNSVGEKYVNADFELLETLAMQGAQAVWNIKLSEDLLAAEEKENLNKVVSFIIHDMKNCASLLNMLSQNSKEYVGNLEFYKDAMETVSSTSEKMNSLISKISTIRVPAKIQTAPVSMNCLVDNALHNISISKLNHLTIKKDLSETLPTVDADGEQIQKVVVNLILNAIDATKENKEGHICISTFFSDSSVGFSVKDNGCGMDEKFISYSLFHAFQTTKKKGLGIGLYQCRHIINEHGGSIDVRSKKGCGSTFTVSLPLTEAVGA